MRVKSVSVFIMLLVLIGSTEAALAVSSYVTTFDNTYPAAANSKLSSCTLCHTSIPARNDYGADFEATHDFASIEATDSDGDGPTNLEEITALTFPGDPADTPGPGTGPEPFTASDAFDTMANWDTVMGNWSLDSNVFGSLSPSFASGAKGKNIAVFTGDPAAAQFTTGHIESNVMLSGKGPKAAIIFSFASPKAYRYVRLEGKKIVVGQVGRIGSDKPGVKFVQKVNVPLEEFHLVQIDVASDGNVTVDTSGLTGTFTVDFGSAQPGQIGFFTTKKGLFDDFAASAP